jgi:hypothetical protein
MLSINIIQGFLLLPVIAALGFVTTYEDLKYSKIKNKWIAAALIYTSLVYVLAWIIHGIALGGGFNGPLAGYASYLTFDFDKWCINFILSAVFSYLIWHLNLWAAGDAKLFIAFAAMIPVSRYSQHAYFNHYFSSFWLLVAIFIPATLRIIIRSLFFVIKDIGSKQPRALLETFKTNVRKKLTDPETYKVAFGFFTIFLFYWIFRHETNAFFANRIPGLQFVYILFFFGFRKLAIFFKIFFGSTLICFSTLIIYFVFKISAAGRHEIFFAFASFGGMALLITVLFPLIDYALKFYFKHSGVKKTPLAPWVFLGVLLVWFF